MDKLKDFIDKNRTAFEEERLPEGHLQRFEEKRAIRKKRQTRRFLWGAFAAAASLTFFFYLHFSEEFGSPSFIQKPLQCTIREEMQELCLYYSMQANETVSRMEELYSRQSLSGAEELLQESRRVLADTEVFEKTELLELPCSEEAFFTINRHYSSSLNCLNEMLDELEEMQRKTTI